MSDEITAETTAEAMFAMVKEYHGKKNLKATDLHKAMREQFGEDQCPKSLCKQAIRQLIESGRCTYSYVGGSFIVLAPPEGGGGAP